MIIITKNLGEPAKAEGMKGSSVSVAAPLHGARHGSLVIA